MKQEKPTDWTGPAEYEENCREYCPTEKKKKAFTGQYISGITWHRNLDNRKKQSVGEKKPKGKNSLGNEEKIRAN